MFNEFAMCSLPKQNAADIRAVRLEKMAGAEGLEPPTCGFGDRRSTS